MPMTELKACSPTQCQLSEFPQLSLWNSILITAARNVGIAAQFAEAFRDPLGHWPIVLNYSLRIHIKLAAHGDPAGTILDSEHLSDIGQSGDPT